MRKSWTIDDEINLINKTQEEYVDDLVAHITSTSADEKAMKSLCFTSPTGTGKTVMMAKLINKLPDHFFVITTLSKGQLYLQIRTDISSRSKYNNYIVYGASSFTSATRFQEKDLISELDRHSDRPIVWLRDEGHIATNRWGSAIENRCKKIINISATNKTSAGIVCNFTHTMMLRTVQQQAGSPEDALIKLEEIKRQHSRVPGYNPCAIFRVVNTNTEQIIIDLCGQYNFSYISLVDNNDYDMEQICNDDSGFDCIINKQKIVEGIDIRRAHVIWIENEPANSATTIQLIGRCRRNALLWRKDIDLLAPDNEQLLKDTRICYAYYNTLNMKIDEDENGELAVAFCPYISIQEIKPGSTIHVDNGQMKNGLFITELTGCSGNYLVEQDRETSFNFVKSPYYETRYTFLHCSMSTQEVIASIPKINAFLYNMTNSYYNHLEASIRKIKETSSRYYNSPVIDLDGKISKTLRRLNGNKFSYVSNHLMIMPDKKTYWGDENICQPIIGQTPEYSKCGVIQINNEYYEFSLEELNYILSHKAISIIGLSPVRFMGSNPIVSVINNYELALVTGDTYYQVKTDSGKNWVTSDAITTKISRNAKFSRFLYIRFNKQINDCKQYFFNVGNPYSFEDKRLNTCLGYCVEYYAKFLLFGEDYLRDHLDKAKKEANGVADYHILVIRACILKYREEIASAYGAQAKRYVPAVTCKALQNNERFIDVVTQLGKRSAKFIESTINIKNVNEHPHAIQSDGLKGLIDITDGETILDIKVTGRIDANMVKQVLAYYYLSQFRSDMKISKVSVYDAITERHIEISLPVVSKIEKSIMLEINDLFNKRDSYQFRNEYLELLINLIPENLRHNQVTNMEIYELYSSFVVSRFADLISYPEHDWHKMFLAVIFLDETRFISAISSLKSIIWHYKNHVNEFMASDKRLYSVRNPGPKSAELKIGNNYIATDNLIIYDGRIIGHAIAEAIYRHGIGELYYGFIQLDIEKTIFLENSVTGDENLVIQNVNLSFDLATNVLYCNLAFNYLFRRREDDSLRTVTQIFQKLGFNSSVTVTDGVLDGRSINVEILLGSLD